MRKLRIKLMFAGLMILLVFLTSCAKAPLKIGFIGSLSTKNSQLSIDARNAIKLAVDQVNLDGGINGQEIQLVIKDDGADIEIAKQKHEEFKNENVALVIGHMTSNMADAVIASQDETLLFLSPSMGATSLTGKDDYFLRTSPLTDNQAVTFIDLTNYLGVKSATIVYDIMNAEYSENMAKHAVTLNKKSQNIDLTLIPFDSRTDEVEEVADRVLNQREPELVFMISQAIDTAVLSQTLRKDNPELLLASVSWSMTDDFILNGGTAVDGMYFVGVFKAEVPSERFLSFKEAFIEEYQYEPTFISILAYDAFHVMVDGLKDAKTLSPSEVKKAILNLGPINGLEETFEMDEFGDNNRGYLIYQLIEGKFVPLYNLK